MAPAFVVVTDAHQAKTGLPENITVSLQFSWPSSVFGPSRSSRVLKGGEERDLYDTAAMEEEDGNEFLNLTSDGNLSAGMALDLGNVSCSTQVKKLNIH